MRGAKARATHRKGTALYLRISCILGRRMCAALRREPHFDSRPPSISGTLATLFPASACVAEATATA
eukprot:7575999-Pyramimonas_sp.AAC.1